MCGLGEPENWIDHLAWSTSHRRSCLLLVRLDADQTFCSLGVWTLFAALAPTRTGVLAETMPPLGSGGSCNIHEAKGKRIIREGIKSWELDTMARSGWNIEANGKD